MMLLQALGITKEYGGREILKDASFEIGSEDRVGLVGKNGAGKSTLLRIVTGEIEPESGSVRWVSPVHVGYLPQVLSWSPDDLLSECLPGVQQETLRRCGVTRDMMSRATGALSGGEKVRAGLAQALSGNPAVLLLDEPTNHLDIQGMAWLEQFLSEFPGAVVTVSHDRYFLDRVARRIIEVENGRLKEYPGSYKSYAAIKAAELSRHKALYERYSKEKKRLEESMRRQTEWARSQATADLPDDAPMNARVYMNQSAEAMMKRVRATERRLARMRVEKPREARSMTVCVDGSANMGRNLILARDLGFSYDGKRWLFRDASFFVQRGDRLAIIGPNGSGKTTLLRIMLGELTPTCGSVHVAPAQVAYLAQETESLTPSNTVLREVSGNDALDQPEVRSLLGCLLFSEDDVLKLVGQLSRGEKIRVAIAKILRQQINLLVLDEPTNGLDLESRERVEEALLQVKATIVMVSHDRYLLSKLSTRVLSIGDGRVESFPGGYDDWVAREPKTGREADLASRILVLETRLARVSHALGDPQIQDKAELEREFTALHKELALLRQAPVVRR